MLSASEYGQPNAASQENKASAEVELWRKERKEMEGENEKGERDKEKRKKERKGENEKGEGEIEKRKKEREREYMVYRISTTSSTVT